MIYIVNSVHEITVSRTTLFYQLSIFRPPGLYTSAPLVCVVRTTMTAASLPALHIIAAFLELARGNPMSLFSEDYFSVSSFPLLVLSRHFRLQTKLSAHVQQITGKQSFRREMKTGEEKMLWPKY